MNNFILRKRLIKYSDKDCKKFLSKDFLHTCCYCLVREGDLGGSADFEKDHFIPQSKSGTDDYDNLNYACRFCNGRSGKSDYYSKTLLNPRTDDIWEHHVILDENFLAVAKTSAGEEFIEHIRLNRRTYINKRRSIFIGKQNCQRKVEKIKSLLENVTDDKLKEEMGEIIAQDQKIIEYGQNFSLNSFELDEDIELAFVQQINEIGICEEVNNDYELLYKIKINGREILCYFIVKELTFVNGKASLKIKMDYLSEWAKIDKDVAIVCYNRKDSKFYWKNVNRLQYDSSKSICQYYLLQSDFTEKIDFARL